MIDNSSSFKKRLKIEWWKIACLALGILLIAGAATYSWATHSSAASNGLLGKGNLPQVRPNTTKSAAVSMNIDDLMWVQNLATKFNDNDFIFVVLPGSDSDLNRTLDNRMAEATAKIEAKGVRVDAMTLSANNPEFSVTKERLAITQLPAVLAISINGNGAIVTGDITEGKLLQTYVVISQPVYAPGSSPGNTW